MAAPVRLRLSRAKGFNLQAHSLAINGLPAVNVARPSHWGNPWRVGGTFLFVGPSGRVCARKTPMTALEAVEKFRSRECRPDRSGLIIHQLRGKNLACWCGLDAPCHADVLLEIANRPICEAM